MPACRSRCGPLPAGWARLLPAGGGSAIPRCAASPEPALDELLVKATNRATTVDEDKTYLHQRWNAGCHDIPQLHRELREPGFTGDVQCVRHCFRPFKKPHSPRPKHPPAPDPEPRPTPKPRRVVRWIMPNIAHLTETVRPNSRRSGAACPELDAAARHVRDFADMMRASEASYCPHGRNASSRTTCLPCRAWSTACAVITTRSPLP